MAAYLVASSVGCWDWMLVLLMVSLLAAWMAGRLGPLLAGR
jgi:hypothetical protein